MSQGPTIVGLGADLGDGLNPWNTPTNIEAHDGLFATASTPAGPTNTLRGTMGSRAFTAPSAVTGVQVDILCEDNAGGAIVVSSAILTQNGAALGTNQAANNAVSSTLGTVSIGGSTNTWGNGASIAAATANSPTFGVDLQFSGGAADSVSVDDVALTIWFAGTTEDAELLAARSTVHMTINGATVRGPVQTTFIAAPVANIEGPEEINRGVQIGQRLYAPRIDYHFPFPPPPGPNSDAFENVPSRISTLGYQPRLSLAPAAAYAVNLRPQNDDLESAETINDRVIIWNP